MLKRKRVVTACRPRVSLDSIVRPRLALCGQECRRPARVSVAVRCPASPSSPAASSESSGGDEPAAANVMSCGRVNVVLKYSVLLTEEEGIYWFTEHRKASGIKEAKAKGFHGRIACSR
jgi:hypothetical protein